MTTDNNEHTTHDEQVINSLLDLVNNPNPADLPLELLDNQAFLGLYARLTDIRNLTAALAKGDLAHHAASKGYLNGTIKTLQANLRHLTWQAKQIAAGDLTQRVDFLGDFADAFNAMVVALDTTQAELRVIASTDGLTGLANRRQIFETGAMEITRAQRYERPLSLMVLDIDFFKKVNDTFGHHAGDEVLKAVAASLVQAVRGTDTVGRMGGEEFAVLLPETSVAQAREVGQRILAQIRQLAVAVPPHQIKVTISIGLTQLAAGDAGLVAVLQRADAALYKAKQTGRDRLILTE